MTNNETLATLQRIHGALAELDPLGRSTDIDAAMDVVFKEIRAITGDPTPKEEQCAAADDL